MDPSGAGGPGCRSTMTATARMGVQRRRRHGDAPATQGGRRRIWARCCRWKPVRSAIPRGCSAPGAYKRFPLVAGGKERWPPRYSGIVRAGWRRGRRPSECPPDATSSGGYLHPRFRSTRVSSPRTGPQGAHMSQPPPSPFRGGAVGGWPWFPAPGLASACSPLTRLPRFPFGGSAAGLFFAPWAFSVLPLATGGWAARRGLVSVAALGSAAARAASRQPRSWVVRISLLTFWASNCWYPQMPPPAKLSRATTARVEASHSLGRLGPDPPTSAWHTLRQVHAPTPPGAWAQRPGLRPHRLPGARQVCVPVWRAEGGALARGGRARLAPHRHGRQPHDPRAQDARVDTVGGARERSGSGRVDDRHELLSLTSSLRVRASMSRRSPRTGPAPFLGRLGVRETRHDQEPVGLPRSAPWASNHPRQLPYLGGSGRIKVRLYSDSRPSDSAGWVQPGCQPRQARARKPYPRGHAIVCT